MSTLEQLTNGGEDEDEELGDEFDIDLSLLSVTVSPVKVAPPRL